MDKDELIMQALGRLENSANEIRKDIASLDRRVAVFETHWDDFGKMKGVFIAAIASPVAVFLIKTISNIFYRA